MLKILNGTNWHTIEEGCGLLNFAYLTDVEKELVKKLTVQQ